MSPIKDMMPTVEHPIYVDGWDELYANNRTKALTLQAIVNLELQGIPATKENILDEVRRASSSLGKKSGTSVLRHINNLKDLGLLTKRPGNHNTAPWRSRFVRPTINDDTYQ